MQIITKKSYAATDMIMLQKLAKKDNEENSTILILFNIQGCAECEVINNRWGA